MTEVVISNQRKANGGERVSPMPMLLHMRGQSCTGRALNNLAGVASSLRSPI